MSKRLEVLDHGFVELVDHMGSDQRIVDSARVSIAGDEVKPSSTNRHLIRYLLRNRHTTPFETVTFTFAVKVPIALARQWMRHRSGSFNEMSARYGVLPEEFYVPEDSRMNAQAKDNHQGSAHELVQDPAYTAAIIKESSKLSFDNYHELINTGLARETARMVVPVNTYTQFYWTVNLWNLMHFLNLRLDSHAQSEIRQYAQAILHIVQPLVPIAVEAFEDYVIDGAVLSKQELTLLKDLLVNTPGIPVREALQKRLGSKREADEFINKFELDMVIV